MDCRRWMNRRPTRPTATRRPSPRTTAEQTPPGGDQPTLATEPPPAPRDPVADNKTDLVPINARLDDHAQRLAALENRTAQAIALITQIDQRLTVNTAPVQPTEPTIDADLVTRDELEARLAQIQPTQTEPTTFDPAELARAIAPHLPPFQLAFVDDAGEITIDSRGRRSIATGRLGGPPVKLRSIDRDRRAAPAN